MKGIKPLAFLFGLVAVSGICLSRPSLFPFGVGLTLFVPALTVWCLKNVGILTSLLVSLAGTIPAVFSGREAAFDLISVILLGLLFYALKGKEVNYPLVAGSFLLTLVAVLEEKLFGLPQQLMQFQNFLNYRFGLYFLSSSLFTAFSYGISGSFCGELYPFSKLKFGFWVILLFIAGALGTLLKLQPLYHLISVNVLIVSLSILMVQGIAVLLSFWIKLSSFWKFFTAAATFVFPTGTLAVATFFGLLDYMVNFRKSNGGRENEGNTP
jgi:hypothetical protein